MRKHVPYFLKAIVLLLLICAVLGVTTRILMPKYFYNGSWPTTSTYLGFYEMEEDSIDVLALGSSHIVSAFSPQELYNNYQITSYNLGGEQQDLVLSYYWLKEALRYQSPKAVILDTYMLFPYEIGDDAGEESNTSEACTRKSLDYMRWSSVKKEAVETICALDEEQSVLSYYFPNIRFHTRWTALTEDDFTFGDMSEHYELKGFSALSDRAAKRMKKYKPFEERQALDEGLEQTQMMPIMKEYLDKMKELCKENNIELILVKTPTDAVDVAKYEICQNYAKENGLRYYDFNEKSLYEEIKYDVVNDNREAQHVNIWGAAKITDYLGKVLSKEYGISSGEEEQWEETKEYYAGRVKDCNLPDVVDIKEYLKLLQDDRYTVFIATRDDAVTALDEEIISLLQALGSKTNLGGQFRCSYYAVIEQGNAEEAIGWEELIKEGTLRDGKASYSIGSAGLDAGDYCSIVIDGKDYAMNQRGLNIVVYNNDMKKVVDAVCFDTFEPTWQAYRE